MTQQGMNVVRALRVALILIVALMAAVSVVAMYSVAASASATRVSSSAESQTGANMHAAAHADGIPHESGSPSVAVYPHLCGADSSSVMPECTPLVSLGGLTAAAQLRAECAAFAPLSPRTAQHAKVVAQPTAPSLHVLSISRT